jgi:NitT/TauT family transport system substrate-binding protein
MDIQAEWTNVDGTAIPLPQTCLIVKNEIVSQKMKAWNLFIEDYMDSIKWVNSNSNKTNELLDHHEVGIPKGWQGKNKL